MNSFKISNKYMSKQLYPHFNENFICNSCQIKLWKKTTYPPTKASRFLNETYCFECVEAKVGFCSFFNKGGQKKCSNPLFNKKKQLCRSHYYQLWKKLNKTKKKLLQKQNQRDKRITGRTQQLNLKVREQTYWRLKELALKNGCLLVEVLERMLERYQI
jgi:hypothetical protein